MAELVRRPWVQHELSAVMKVPTHMLGTNGSWRARFGAKSATHSPKSHTHEKVVGGSHPVRTKKTVLGAVCTPGWTQGKRPGVKGPKSRAERPGAGVANKFLSGVGGGLERIVFHGPQQEDGIPVRWNLGEMTEMGCRDVEGGAETVKTPDVVVVARQSLWCPGVSGVDHSHAFQEHEGVEGATGGRHRSPVGPDSAEFADKRIPSESLWEEEPPRKVPIA
jgi:hypothetical protein